MSERIIFDLHISAEEYQRYYSGSAKAVVTRALDGRVVRFPANVLQKVVTHDGIRGRFVIEFSEDGRFQGIARL
jgi:hypothetical protein